MNYSNLVKNNGRACVFINKKIGDIRVIRPMMYKDSINDLLVEYTLKRNPKDNYVTFFTTRFIFKDYVFVGLYD